VPNFPIQTARLLLRPFRQEDEDGLHRLWNDPLVRRYLWDRRPVPREVVVKHIERSQRNFKEHGFGHFTISPTGAPMRMIGFVGLVPREKLGFVELYYGLLPSYWGKGMATEAARAVLQFGFEEIGLPEIVAGSDQPNTSSFRVMERLGMTFAGERRAGKLPVRYYRIRREAFASAALR
jgi:ribosomal-protein-alanine N-acetyltransferase